MAGVDDVLPLVVALLLLSGFDLLIVHVVWILIRTASGHEPDAIGMGAVRG